jgi:ArsR family transcriptional regulator
MAAAVSETSDIGKSRYEDQMKTLDATTLDEARAVQLFRALANPARYRIVQHLAARNGCMVGDLVEVLPLTQSSVSEHLTVLKDAGLVQGTIDGPNRCYGLDPEAFAFLRTLMTDLERQACW